MNRFLNQTFGKKNSPFQLVQNRKLLKGISRVEIIALDLDTGIGFQDLWMRAIMLGSRYCPDIMLKAHELVRCDQSTM